MTPAEALEQAKGAARVWQIRIYVRHARDRSSERNAQAADIRAAILSAHSAEWWPKEQTWRLRGGKDVDGDDLDVALAFEEHCIRVVTIF